jgi:hypothetical protein
MEVANMSEELDRLLRNMAAKEEPIPKGFGTAKDFSARWGTGMARTSEILRTAHDKKLAERRQVARRCGNKTMKIWVYRLVG